jgi:hypothetical protein
VRLLGSDHGVFTVLVQREQEFRINKLREKSH